MVVEDMIGVVGTVVTVGSRGPVPFATSWRVVVTSMRMVLIIATEIMQDPVKHHPSWAVSRSAIVAVVTIVVVVVVVVINVGCLSVPIHTGCG